jgi:hypothetical protein
MNKKEKLDKLENLVQWCAMGMVFNVGIVLGSDKFIFWAFAMLYYIPLTYITKQIGRLKYG